MRLLIWLSLAYAAVLVTALAVSLTLILVHLWRVRGALGGVAAPLADVAARTAPLHGAMADLAAAIEAVHKEVGEAAAATVRAGSVLGIEPPEPPEFQAHAVSRWQQAAQ